jgi:transposase
MHLRSILNRVERHTCFVCKHVRFVDGATEPEIEVVVEPRANSRAICSGCGEKHDRLSPRRLQFVPFWSIAVFFVYAMRRVDCPLFDRKRVSLTKSRDVRV